MARVTAADLSRYQSLEAEAAELAARASTLRREAKTIVDKATEDLEGTGKPTAKRGGFLLRWKVSRGSVAWKTEFVRIAGAEAADELTKSAPERRSLEIIAPAPAE